MANKIRDEKGRFLPGRPALGTEGRKPLEKEREYTKALREAISPDDITQIAEKVKHYLLNENLSTPLIKLVFEYLIEKPTQHKVLQIIDETGETQLITLLQNLNKMDISVNQFLFDLNKQLSERNDNDKLQ